MTNEERLDRLEKLYEKLYHESELLSMYIPRLTDILIRYWNASDRHRGEVLGDLRNLRDVLKQHINTHLDKKGSYKYK